MGVECEYQKQYLRRPCFDGVTDLTLDGLNQPHGESENMWKSY